ncbi:MAG: phospho-N-acetylmuramoyl-pentapeptide-transferase [Elusimicrobiota bacterium]
MLYHLLYPFSDVFSPLNVMRYITFRAAMAFITALIINFIIAPSVIRWLKNKKRIQVIKSDAPERHMQKQGTPTMGGIIILLSLIISVLLWARLDNIYIIILLGSTLWLGMLGFIDDNTSSTSVNPKGISPAFKLLWQVVLGIVLAAYFYMNPTNPAAPYSLSVPFFKDFFINLGSLYIFFIIITIVATSNAVNITDGLDGLAIGGIIFAALTYSVLTYISGHSKFSAYLFLPHIKGSGEISIFLMTLAGAGLGFLWYNIFPAQIFMGDTASLFMGGVIGISAIIIRQEILLLIVGGVFLVEIMSVIIQVFFFRWKGKRVFKMAPLHHHFELCGWSEPQVVVRFWIIAIILSLAALATLKLR